MKSTTDPALEEAWSTAARAIADDDSAAFLTVATQNVYDKMTAEQQSVKTVQYTTVWFHSHRMLLFYPVIRETIWVVHS